MKSIPFFVTGSPKSGTTWLGKLLDAHPEISCKGEACVHAFRASLAHACGDYNKILELRAGRFSDANAFPPMDDPEILSLMRHFVESRLARIADQGKPALKFVGEKDPLHAGAIPFLHEMFPEAKIIHIIRDGRAVVLSAWHHNMRILDGQGLILTSGGFKYTGNESVDFDAFVDIAANRWAAFIRTARATAHVLGNQYLEVRYEDLSSDTMSSLKRILLHLGADASEETAQACAEAASFEKLSQGRSRGQEDSKSFFRKGIADDWKNRFTPAQVSRCNARSGGMLQELGYMD